MNSIPDAAIHRQTFERSQLVTHIADFQQRGDNIIILGDTGVGKSYLLSCAFPEIRVIEGIKYRHRPLFAPMFQSEVYLADEVDYFEPEQLQMILGNAAKVSKSVILVCQGNILSSFTEILLKSLQLWMPHRKISVLEITSRQQDTYQISLCQVPEFAVNKALQNHERLLLQLYQISSKPPLR